jgi:hypothetical protein
MYINIFFFNIHICLPTRSRLTCGLRYMHTHTHTHTHTQTHTHTHTRKHIQPKDATHAKVLVSHCARDSLAERKMRLFGDTRIFLCGRVSRLSLAERLAQGADKLLVRELAGSLSFSFFFF